MKSLSRVRLFATPWTVAYQAPPSMGFSRQEYWSGLPFPSPGDLPDPGIEPGSAALQADALHSEPPGKPAKWKNPFSKGYIQDGSIYLKAYVHTKMCFSVCSSSIHSHTKLETGQISFNRWRDKQTLLHPCNGISLSHWGESAIDVVSAWMHLRGIVLSERK